jgi:site-specific DNA-methyltransferase (adenine-specific)/modification methylase
MNQFNTVSVCHLGYTEQMSKVSKKPMKKTSKSEILDQIFNENCLDTIKKIPDASVDVVITSPPYNMNLRIRNGVYTSRQIVKELSTKYEGFSDNMPIEDFYKFHSEVIRELLRISNLVFYNIQIVTGSKRAFFKIIGDFSDNLKEIIIWDKGNGQPAMQEQVLNRRSELLLVFENDYPISRQFRSATFKRGTLDDVWLIKRERKKGVVNHGATFPEELIKTILKNFSKENDVIYDPFLGTGTTAIVAKMMNRRYIGSELSKEYFEICKKKLQEDRFLDEQLEF